MHTPTATADSIDSHVVEVESGERFEFGKNWSNFLRVLDDDRIDRAVASLRRLLGVTDLKGLTFIDVGSGSGLFSLAAYRLGARVRSFDYDAASVACTVELKRRYGTGGADWSVERGSILDKDFLASLGQFDVVYSWGVLHHTGSMWEAIENAAALVAPGGLFAIAIYNDQGVWSKRWTALKKFYCSGPFGKTVMCATYIPAVVTRQLLADLFWFRNPTKYYTDYRTSRGMSVFYDWFDWLGGFPFEVAKPEVVFKFGNEHGLTMTNFTTCGGSVGCNEFVFRRGKSPTDG
jgi:2-polyprenyl-6-hydroxyphenyl methylase/3-demethylubiquinone-9 3-methyltransferase